METVASMIIPSLGNFFATLEQFSWIGSATNFVHLEDTIIDQTVEKLATQLAMQVPLMKVHAPLLSSIPLLFLNLLSVHSHALSCDSIRGDHEMDPLSNHEASLLYDSWDLVNAMDLWE
jgi:hypothetical protein